MKLASNQSARDSIAAALAKVRCQTLELLALIRQSQFVRQVHPEFSPIGWHFGHIAFTEAYWIAEYLANAPLSFPDRYQSLFAADGLPKAERQNLPDVTIVEDYLQTVRIHTLEYLATAPVERQERLWRWLVQHEAQHGETIAFLWQLHQQSIVADLSYRQVPVDGNLAAEPEGDRDPNDMVEIPAGRFVMGSNAPDALDNERPAHEIYLDRYWLDRYPVTCKQYLKFMQQGGYRHRKYWSQAGWQWLQQNPVDRPLYWSNSIDWHNHPVAGVSYYEAEAYANFVGKRLPTEAEWEKASQGTELNCNHSGAIGHTTPVDTYSQSSQFGCRDMLGNVWEWTDSWFAGYPDFTSYPYRGYSAVYFDNCHRVLRGGSWATSSAALRTSFRNWYHPNVRQILVGFRCAS